MQRRFFSARRSRPLPTARVTALALLSPLLLSIASLSGCQTVEPWERGALASPRMQPEPNALDSELLDHIHQSRESATVGGGSGGASCGCY